MPDFIKDFIRWFKLKIRLDAANHNPPLFKEGEVWWCSVGENIGREISGKGDYFRRPLLILRKLDKFSFIGLPLTSQPKTGTWYVKVKIKEKDNFIILPQVHYMDYKRMDKILSTLNNDDLKRIREAFVHLIMPTI